MRSNPSSLDAEQVAAIWAHVASLETIELFGHSNNHQRLFRFLVAEELSGRGPSHNAYSVGIDGLGKPESFDPAKDSSLRVAMHAIRTALKNYYSGQSTLPVQISLPLGGYGAVFTFNERVSLPEGSVIPDLTQVAQPNTRPDNRSIKSYRLQIGAIALLCGALIAAFSWTTHNRSEAKLLCADARPIVRVEVNGGNDAPQVKALVEEYLAYYPILTLETGRKEPCGRLPKFTLHLDHIPPSSTGKSRDGGYALRVVDAFSNNMVWNRAYEAQENIYYPTLKLIAAQIAYDVGHGNGVIANKARGRLWGNNDEAEKRFLCLADTHRYFSSGELKLLDEVTKCAGRYWSTSSMADLVGLYAALQYEIAGMAGISKEAELQAMERLRKALSRASELSPTDKEVVTVKLKIARTASPINVAGAAQQLAVINKYLTMEPHALNQAAITEAVYLGNVDAAFVLSKKAGLITQNNEEVFTGELYYYVAHQEWPKTGNYLYNIISWEFPKEQLIALCIAEKNGVPELASRARANLQRFAVRSNADMAKIIEQQFPNLKMRAALRSCLNVNG